MALATMAGIVAAAAAAAAIAVVVGIGVKIVDKVVAGNVDQIGFAAENSAVVEWQKGWVGLTWLFAPARECSPGGVAAGAVAASQVLKGEPSLLHLGGRCCAHPVTHQEQTYGLKLGR